MYQLFHAVFLFSSLFSCISPSYALLCSNPPVPSSRIYLRLLFHAASMPAANTASLFVWQTTAGDGFGALCNIYENCELPSLFRCFLCGFIWRTTEKYFEKAGRNRKDLLKMAMFLRRSDAMGFSTAMSPFSTGTPRTPRGIKNYDLFCYHYAEKKKV